MNKYVKLAAITLLAIVILVGSMTLLGGGVQPEVFQDVSSGLSTSGGSNYAPAESAPPPATAPMAAREAPAEEEAAAEEEVAAVEDIAEEGEIEEENVPTDEEREQAEVNPFVLATEDNLSTFAMDVDTASYASARNYITNGSLPYAGEVRVEEFVNYFDYNYPEPEQAVFGISVDAAPSPWRSATGEDTQIVRVGLQGKHIDDSERKDAILTFVIDISGSMSDWNRLPMVKQALTLLVDELRPTDQVAIVVYSDTTRAVLEPTSAEDRDAIIEAIESLQVEGSTNVEDGLRLGYEIAGNNYDVDAINRVILCSDGVANVGATGPDAIRAVIRDYTAQGVLLSTIGFGMGNYNDYLMEQLADDGNGNYAYVDTLDEAQRIFVENLTGMLQVIASDAKIQVEFNPEVVYSYRLLGYENRDVADEDFRNDTVDAGEVGAGHSVTALYEVVPTQQGQGTAMTVRIRYENMDTGEVEEVAQPLDSSDFGASFDEMSPHFQLAVAVAGFAEHLRGSGYVQGRSLEDVLAIAERIAPDLGNDNEVQEFVELVRKATEI
jgi:Ca-activated chloride channel homolog